jgi:phosphoglycolate phosphatase
MPRCILFDFDGTLADTFRDGVEILNILAKEFGFRPLGADETDHARDLSTLGLMEHLGIPRMKLRRIAKRGTEEITRRIATVEAFPEILPLIGHLHAAGFPLGILTSNSEPNVQTFLKKEGLEVFAFIKSSSKLLGKGAVLRRILRERHLKPREIFFIGDELRDIEAAQEAGVHVAAVTWGYNSRHVLAEAGPDYLFDTPAEISALLDPFTAQKESPPP